MPLAKRKSEVIDLTGDDAGRGSQINKKRPVFSSSQSSRLNSASVSESSQRSTGMTKHNSIPLCFPASQADLDYLDLTQEDEGPARELYCTFGRLYDFRMQVKLLTRFRW